MSLEDSVVPDPKTFDAIDHVAIPVKDIAEAVDWYTRTFQCGVQYQDSTWALLSFANMRLALVIPEQHPTHIGLVSGEAERFGELRLHRDGTRSCYVRDPAGNAVEILDKSSMNPVSSISTAEIAS